MNYAALLGVVAAVAFMLPLLARLAELLGLHRNLGVGVSLIIAAGAAAVWYVKSVRSRSVAQRRAMRAQSRIAEMGTVAPAAATDVEAALGVAGSPAEEPDEGI